MLARAPSTDHTKGLEPCSDIQGAVVVRDPETVETGGLGGLSGADDLVRAEFLAGGQKSRPDGDLFDTNGSFRCRSAPCAYVGRFRLPGAGLLETGRDQRIAAAAVVVRH